MKSISIFCMIFSLSWPIVGMAQTSIWNEGDWRPLTNEPSRQELQRLATSSQIATEAIPRRFSFPEGTENLSNEDYVFGIDISHYNSIHLPFAEMKKKNIRFVYIKATQGVAFKDPKFQYFWRSVEAQPENNRVARGAFHFLSAGINPETQADRFVAYVNLQGGFKAGDLPPVVDLEWDKANTLGVDHWQNEKPAEIVSATLQFLERVETLTGRVPMIYTSRAWWRERDIPDSEISRFARYKLWLADYSKATLQNEDPLGPGNIVPNIWQFTDQAHATGYSGSGFDANVFKGSWNEFLQSFL